MAMLISAVILTLVALLLWYLQPRYSKDEPRPVSHIIPILGRTLFWANHRRAFFEWGDREAKGAPYSVLIAGRKHYVFSKPSDIATVFRRSTSLSIQPFVRMLYEKLFGMQSDDITKLEGMTKELHEMNKHYLLRPENFTAIALRYHTDLNARLLRLRETATTSGSVVVDMFDLLLDNMSASSTVAYFGEAAVKDYPDLGQDMATFVQKGFWKALAGVPVYFLGEATRAREKIKATLLKATMGADSAHDTSPLVQESIRLMQPSVSLDGQLGYHFAFAFGFIANSTPTIYNLLLRILLQPGLVDELRAEHDKSELEYPSISPSALPLLQSCYYEAIRMHTVSASIRQVTEPVTIELKQIGDRPTARYQLQKGGIVNLPSSTLHFDPEINPDPDTFHPRRFLETALGGEGQNLASCTRGFGGGANYCPGRIFAQRQIMGFIALLLRYFDVEIVGTEWQIPTTNEFDDVVKTKHASVRLTLRN